MAANMYRVGDYVYFETSSTTPYQIRRVEELCKTPTGNVEAKVMCFYRRRDISSSLTLLADKHQSGGGEEDGEDTVGGSAAPPTTPAAVTSKDEMSEKQRHQLKHRELFLSRQVETLPATHIRGKCNITLLNETESLMSYLSREDTFFYSLVYDPQQKTLLADKGEIRVGTSYQAEITSLLPSGDSDGRSLDLLEQLQWIPTESCSDKQLNQFLIVSRSVGAFARALDCTSTVRQPSLHMSAAAASRDITLFHAMDVLHKSGYDLTAAMSSLVPPTGPVLCRDEMEEWSASEANLFEEALDKYGKDFNDIRQDFLPWKSLKSIVEYYYMWKTTDRYVQQKRIKAAEAESKLKQVYIPSYNKPNPAQISDKVNGVDSASDRACESCYTTHSAQWYAWGPTHMQCRLCAGCWNYWKKYGGLKMPTRLDGSATVERAGQQSIPGRSIKCTIANCGKDCKSKAHLAQHLQTAHGLVLRPAPGGVTGGSSPPCPPGPVMKTRAAFCLVTTPLTRISRQVCKGILDISRAARRPLCPINIALIKQECQQRLPELLHKLRLLTTKKRVPMERVSARLGIDVRMDRPSLLHHSSPAPRGGERGQPPPLHAPPPRHAFPAAQSALPQQQRSSRVAPPKLTEAPRKRVHEQVNGAEEGPAIKHPAPGVIRQAGSVKQMQPKMRGSTMNRLNGCASANGSGVGGVSESAGAGRGRRRLQAGWMDTPDDVCFIASDPARQYRRQMTNQELRRGARKPWQRITSKTPPPLSSEAEPLCRESVGVVILD